MWIIFAVTTSALPTASAQEAQDLASIAKERTDLEAVFQSDRDNGNGTHTEIYVYAGRRLSKEGVAESPEPFSYLYYHVRTYSPGGPSQYRCRNTIYNEGYVYSHNCLKEASVAAQALAPDQIAVTWTITNPRTEQYTAVQQIPRGTGSVAWGFTATRAEWGSTADPPEASASGTVCGIDLATFGGQSSGSTTCSASFGDRGY
jgi:hypothetical protein